MQSNHALADAALSYSACVGVFQELSGQGRVVGGHLSGGTVVAGGTGPFSKNSDLAIQHASNPFKRHRINADTVTEWGEFATNGRVAGAVGQAAAAAAIPGRVGKAVGAGLGAAVNSGHTVRITWAADGKQSIIELPEKQFMVFSVLLKDRQVATEVCKKLEVETPPGRPAASERLAELALSVLSRSRQEAPMASEVPGQDVTEQIAKLAELHAQGILTDKEFSAKKAELLQRL
jgi:hypothetical protein